MKLLTFWFDPVSPYSYLAFERLPQALDGLSVSVTYKPVLFAGLLKHWGQKGPAEIEPKRAWTYRQIAWQAREHGIELQMPAAHPFNPLPLLRLLWACTNEGDTPNRRQCERVLRHVWRGGAAADDAVRVAELAQQLKPRIDPAGDEAKQRLRAATDEAIARQVFGVPTIEAEDGRLFWGFDSLPMLAASLRGDAWFDESWDAVAARAASAQRTAPKA
jgi:2-hydroxychromene-2-carboxylate isomerase